MKRCKHKRTSGWVRRKPYAEYESHWITCDDCGAYLSFGPANDVGCEVEITAVIMVATGTWHLLADLHDISSGEFEPPLVTAGFLARVICEHES